MIEETDLEKCDKRCPICEEYLYSAPWWDDPPEDGGAVIATWYECHTDGCTFESDWD